MTGTNPAAGNRRQRGTWLSLVTILLAAVVSPQCAVAGDPFVDAVVSFTPGSGAGFGADKLPGIVLGPPVGGGDLQGSLDVVSLGNGGSIVLAFRDNIICDRPGPDFTIFENPFHSGDLTGPIFVEVGIVAVSQDGEHFVEFPYDPQTFEGLAGRTPVYSNPDNHIDPTDPSVSGGDSFDLAQVGLPWAVYVRITDPGAAIPDPGNRVPGGDSAGFDLDAIAAIHSCDPIGSVSPTPSATPSPTTTPTEVTSMAPSDTPTMPPPTVTPTNTPPLPTETATAPTASVTPTVPPASPTPIPADIDGNGVVDVQDLTLLIQQLFDDVPRSAAADVNADGAMTAADCPAVVLRIVGGTSE